MSLQLRPKRMRSESEVNEDMERRLTKYRYE